MVREPKLEPFKILSKCAMNMIVHDFGKELNRLVVIDDFLPKVERDIEMAATLAPSAPERAMAYPPSHWD
jgi:hypothetical protein